MSFAEKVDSVIGLTAADPAVKAFLSEIGENPEVELPDDDDSFYVENQAAGYSLLFKDHSFIRNPAYRGKNPGVPVLCTVFFYSEGHEGFSEFQGKLPMGAKFSDGPEDLTELLGPASDESAYETGEMAFQKWDTETRYLNITYNDAGTAVKLATYGLIQYF